MISRLNPGCDTNSLPVQEAWRCMMVTQDSTSLCSPLVPPQPHPRECQGLNSMLCWHEDGDQDGRGVEGGGSSSRSRSGSNLIQDKSSCKVFFQRPRKGSFPVIRGYNSFSPASVGIRSHEYVDRRRIQFSIWFHQIWFHLMPC